MSIYRYYYEDEDGERRFEVVIDYDYIEGEWLRVGNLPYRTRAEIEIVSVQVEAVTYYNPNGDKVAYVKREDMSQESTAALDAEAYREVVDRVGTWSYLTDKLIDNA
jgi:hypothetical protein